MAKTFNAFTETNSTLMIVDSLNLAFRYSHSGATDFAEDYLRTIQSLARSYKASHVVLACDKGSSKYRKSIYPEYKQNRKDKFAEQTDADREKFEKFFSDFEASLVHVMENTVFPVIRFDGVEADDIAGYLVNKRSKYSFDNIWLVSSDRDWDLLVKDGVSRFSYVTRKETTIDNWFDHYDCTPEEYISIKCLNGDTGDNVKGVPLIGPKRALELVQQYGTALDIMLNLPLPGKQKFIQNLNASSDLIDLNYRLMDIETFCEEAIGAENCIVIDNIMETYLNGSN